MICKAKLLIFVSYVWYLELGFFPWLAAELPQSLCATPAMAKSYIT